MATTTGTDGSGAGNTGTVPRQFDWAGRRAKARGRSVGVFLLGGWWLVVDVGPGAARAEQAAPAVGPDERAGEPEEGVETPRATPLYQTVVVAREPTHARARADDAASASVVTSDRTPRGAESATELLAELPGVAVTRVGGLGSLATLSLRGSTADQVGIYLDGIPLNTAAGGGVDLGLLPIGDMERLEVYRGMSPLIFPASALGGIVALSSRVPASDSASLEAGGGSFGTGYLGGQATARRGAFGALLGLHALSSAGDFRFPNDNGTAFDPADDRTEARANNQLRQLDGTARLRWWLPGRRALTASLWGLTRAQGLPGHGLRTAAEAALETRRLISSLRYESRDDLGAGGNQTVQIYALGVEQRFLDELGELGMGQSRTRDRSLRWGATTTAGKHFTEWLLLRALLDGNHETFSPTDELDTGAVDVSGQRSFFAAGAESVITIAPIALDLQPSVRVEWAHDEVIERDQIGRLRDTTRPEDHVLPIVRLSAVEHLLPTFAVRGNLGRYARLPSLRERYGNTGLFLGNPDLRPEHGVNADLGVTFDYVRADQAPSFAGFALRLDAAAFVARVDDLILFEQGSYSVRAANLDRALVKGVETAIAMRVWRYGRLSAQATYTDARDTSDIAARSGNQLPLRPRWHGFVRPEVRGARLPWLGAGWAAGVYADLDHTAGNFLDGANLVGVPSRTVFGAGITLDLARTGMRLLVTARNLGDSHIVDLTGYPLPGRSIFFTLQWNSENQSETSL